MINYIKSSFQKATQSPLYKIASFGFIAVSLGLIAAYMDLRGVNANLIIIFILATSVPLYICFYFIVWCLAAVIMFASLNLSAQKWRWDLFDWMSDSLAGVIATPFVLRKKKKKKRKKKKKKKAKKKKS